MQITQALNLIRAFADEMGNDVTVTLPMVFLRVAQAGAEGVDHGQLQADLKLGSSSASRAVQTLGDVHYNKNDPGYQLVERGFDAKDNRRRVLRLTAKGEKFLQKICASKR